jgi:hypothetical protein
MFAIRVAFFSFSYFLGYYLNEIDAKIEYENALEYFNENSDLINCPFKTKRKTETHSTNINQLRMDFSLT